MKYIIDQTLKDCYTRGINVKFLRGIDITSHYLDKRFLTKNKMINYYIDWKFIVNLGSVNLADIY